MGAHDAICKAAAWGGEGALEAQRPCPAQGGEGGGTAMASSLWTSPSSALVAACSGPLARCPGRLAPRPQIDGPLMFYCPFFPVMKITDSHCFWPAHDIKQKRKVTLIPPSEIREHLFL